MKSSLWPYHSNVLSIMYFMCILPTGHEDHCVVKTTVHSERAMISFNDISYKDMMTCMWRKNLPSGGPLHISINVAALVACISRRERRRLYSHYNLILCSYTSNMIKEYDEVHHNITPQELYNN